ncbi:MAG: sulfite exporter TauE/SafE family protein, partial [Methanobacteriota archaeon]
GSLYTPILFLLGYATLISISTSLVLNLVTALSASIVYYRSNLVDIRFALWFIPGICLGAYLGGVMTAFINPAILMWLFVIFLIGAGGRMIYTYWERAVPEGACPIKFSQGMYALIVVFSFFVGIISGLLGVGGGIIIVPFLIFLCRYPTKNSAGVVSFIVIFSSIFGVLGHLRSGSLDVSLILGTVVAVFIGATIGARSMVKISSGYIKAGFGVVLWIFAVQLILKLMNII